MLDHEHEFEPAEGSAMMADISSGSAAAADSKEDEPLDTYTAIPEDTGLSGYLSYTVSAPDAPRLPDKDAKKTGGGKEEDIHEHGKDWMAYASIVGGALSVYSSPMVFSGVLLGVSAAVLGVLASFGKKRTLAIIGILAGLAGVILSVLLASLYVELFNIVSAYLRSGFGFRTFGW